MTHEPTTPSRWRRRWPLLLCLAICLPVPGCGFLLDEFTTLNRVPPQPDPAAALHQQP